MIRIGFLVVRTYGRPYGHVIPKTGNLPFLSYRCEADFTPSLLVKHFVNPLTGA